MLYAAISKWFAHSAGRRRPRRTMFALGLGRLFCSGARRDFSSTAVPSLHIVLAAHAVDDAAAALAAADTAADAAADAAALAGTDADAAAVFDAAAAKRCLPGASTAFWRRSR